MPSTSVSPAPEFPAQHFHVQGDQDYFQHWPTELTPAETSLRNQFDAFARMKAMLFIYVLQRGKLFSAAPRPSDVPKMQDRQCYANAIELVTRYPERYAYVEGYGQNFLATPHAWCVTREGTVVDPTWKNPEQCAYWGIPIDPKFLSRQMSRQGVYGLLGDMPKKEVIKAPVEKMVHPWWREEIQARDSWPELEQALTRVSCVRS